MDDDLQQLEAELKSLRPGALSRELLARLERELAPAAPVRRASAMWWLWAAALPAAAALALLVTLNAWRPRSNPAQKISPTDVAASELAVFKPIAAENVLYSASDEGLIKLDDGTAARRERLSYVDTITWKNPRTNASVRWSVPREEVRVVPVIFQ
jgi:hypothetical protein